MKCAMCIQGILQFSAIICLIFLVQKCGHVLYICELKNSFFHITCWYKHIESIKNNVHQYDLELSKWT